LVDVNEPRLEDDAGDVRSSGECVKPSTQNQASDVKIDLRYAAIEYELWALGHMLSVIEPAIERLSQEGETEILERLRRDGWEDDEAERQFAWQDISEIQEHVLPRFMRGPFVVALWACFEASVRAVARTMQAEAQSPKSLDDLRKPKFPLRARSYFKEQFNLALDEDDARFERLSDLYAVRNGLAHTNGLREGMTPREWTGLHDALARSGTEASAFPLAVVLTRDYVEQAYGDVIECLRSLLARVRSHAEHRG
jgi:hypothetical protein